MPKVRNIIPRKEQEVGAGRAVTPFTHSMEEFFENFFPRRWMEGLEPFGWRRPMWPELEENFDFLPNVDIVDKDDYVLVRAEMPGVKKEHLEITIAGDWLNFEARREVEETEEKDDFFRHEMAYGRLFRTLRLPVEVHGDKATAELKDGIVELHLPKVEVTTPHKIKVA